MKFTVADNKLSCQASNALVFGLFEGARELSGEALLLDEILGGAISQSVEMGRISGKSGELEIFHAPKGYHADLIAVAGLGRAKDLTADKLRRTAAGAGRALRRAKASSIAFQLPASKISVVGVAQAVTEGFILGLYAFRRHITKKSDYSEVSGVTLLVDSSEINQAVQGVKKGKIIAAATALARDMVNEPGSLMTADNIAGIAQDIAKKHKLGITVLEQEQMRALGMNGILSVNRGSDNDPKFIILTYKGMDTQVVDLALIGKGITFDSGGISIKPSDGMGDMKGDMAGAAAVIAAMSAIAQLKPSVNVTAVVAAVENMPGGNAYKPGDVVKAMNGKTIEVITTDAEGRITLADALSYVNAKIKPKAIVDVATLTGACIVALGNVASGVFANNQPLADMVLAAGRNSGELSWQMPMFDEYKELNNSSVADMKNTGGRAGGAITAALFLAEFAGSTPWVHIDIAGVDMSQKEQGYYVKGATGIPVRTLVTLALETAEK